MFKLKKSSLNQFFFFISILSLIHSSAVACLSITKPFFVEESSFAQEDFKVQYTPHGIALETGGNYFVFSQKEKKWCLLANLTSNLDCSIASGEVELTAAKDPNQKPVGLFEFSMDSKPCLLVYSLNAEGKKDTSKSYLKVCDISELKGVNADTSFSLNSIGASVSLLKKTGEQKGIGHFVIPVEINQDNSFSQLISRTVGSIEKNGTRVSLDGHSLKRSACGATSVEDYGSTPVAHSLPTNSGDGSSNTETPNHSSQKILTAEEIIQQLQ